MKSNTREIKDTLEKIRTKKYSDIASSVVYQIVDIEFENQEQDSRAVGKSKVKEALELYVDATVTNDSER